MSQTRPKLNSSTLHAVQDRQGKIYIASKETFGWWTVEELPLPAYGYKDLGLVSEAYNRLAQYRHAARILNTTVSTGFNNLCALVKEIDNGY